MKTKLRKELQNIRKNIKNKEQLSTQIAEKLINQQFYKDAETIMVYVSFNDEVDTRRLIDKMLTDGKTLCAPVCKADGTMCARRFSSFGDLRKGAFGILEPSGEKITNIDLVIVPGVGFNENLHRIGYGKGYYDRFLENFKGVTCGLFYEEQKAEFVEESHDLPLDYIICETKILKRE